MKFALKKQTYFYVKNATLLDIHLWIAACICEFQNISNVKTCRQIHSTHHLLQSDNGYLCSADQS